MRSGFTRRDDIRTAVTIEIRHADLESGPDMALLNREAVKTLLCRIPLVVIKARHFSRPWIPTRVCPHTFAGDQLPCPISI